MFTVYILLTSRNTLYTGQTNNLEKRLEQHRNKSREAAKYTKGVNSFELVYKEEFTTRGEALKREYQIKQLTRKKKLELIQAIDIGRV